MNELAVSAVGIHMAFQKRDVLKGLDFHVKKGDICALLGPNGAGKTTLLKILTGLALPQQGSVSLFGEQLKNNALRRVGAFIDKPSLYSGKTAIQNLKLQQELLGLPEDRWETVLEQVGLTDHSSKKASRLSQGMKQRLAIGMALMGNPDLLILDEPVNSLDTQGMHHIRQLLKRLNREQGVTMIISSHLLDEMSLLASSYAFLKRGQIQQIPRSQLEIQSRSYGEILTGNSQRAIIVLDRLGFLEDSYEIMENGALHIYDKLDQLAQINAALVQENIQVSGLRIVNKTLADFYLDKMREEE